MGFPWFIVLQPPPPPLLANKTTREILNKCSLKREIYSTFLYVKWIQKVKEEVA